MAASCRARCLALASHPRTCSADTNPQALSNPEAACFDDANASVHCFREGWLMHRGLGDCLSWSPAKHSWATCFACIGRRAGKFWPDQSSRPLPALEIHGDQQQFWMVLHEMIAVIVVVGPGDQRRWSHKRRLIANCGHACCLIGLALLFLWLGLEEVSFGKYQLYLPGCEMRRSLMAVVEGTSCFYRSSSPSLSQSSEIHRRLC